MLGYTFFCRQFQVARSTAGPATLTVRVENRGIAPIYYSWPVEAEEVDTHGTTVGSGRALWPLATLLPGKSADWSLTLNALPGDAAAILLHIPNLMRGGHPIAFANAEMGATRDGWLTLTLANGQ
jgi:hypothetical protein